MGCERIDARTHSACGHAAAVVHSADLHCPSLKLRGSTCGEILRLQRRRKKTIWELRPTPKIGLTSRKDFRVDSYRFELCLHVCNEGVAGLTHREVGNIRVAWHYFLHVAHLPVFRSPQQLHRYGQSDVIHLGRCGAAIRWTWCVAVVYEIESEELWMGLIASSVCKRTVANLCKM